MIPREITLGWLSIDLSDDKSPLVQVMAWCREATKPLLYPILTQFYPLPKPYGITRTQWVKTGIKGPSGARSMIGTQAPEYENTNTKIAPPFCDFETLHARLLTSHANSIWSICLDKYVMEQIPQYEKGFLRTSPGAWHVRKSPDNVQI